MFISIDLDAFYCGVEEHLNPRLRDEAFCVVQKHCIATLSYPARALGLKKLDNIHDARRRFPNIRCVNGEDLSKYKKAGNDIHKWLQDICGLPAERLGIEELRMNVNPIIDEFVARLPPLDQLKAWIQDPEFMDEVGAKGLSIVFPGSNNNTGAAAAQFPNFFFKFEGQTLPPGQETLAGAQDLRAYAAGHLACYIRDRMWLELGYSCSIGMAPAKNLAKMAGSCQKPRGVTVLDPQYVPNFVKSVAVKQVPGLGSACRHALECESSTESVGQLLARFDGDPHEFLVRLRPVVGDQTASNLWELLNGNDIEGRSIKPFELPLQISVEESYSGWCPPAKWSEELAKISTAVVSQAIVDWYDEESREWRRVPAQCRVSLIYAYSSYTRKSKSIKYTWSIYEPPESVGDQLAELSLQLMEQLVETHNGKPRVINIALIGSES